MKYLETTKTREAREAVIEAQQLTLKRAWDKLNDDDDRANLDALNDALTAEWIELRKDKEWIITFTDGGWNTIMAPDRQLAVQRASGEYFHAINKEPVLRSENEDVYKNLILNFN